jgi:membrane protease YdiL (CAAX protease family)
MKREIKIAILVFFGFLSFLWFEKPLRELLVEILLEKQLAKEISGITIRLMLISIIFFIINKLRLTTFTGLNSWQKVRNLQAILIPMAFIILGIANNWSTYAKTEIHLLLLFIISTFAVGIVEEFAFRGTIFPLLIKSFINAKQPIVISAVMSSLMFGLIHFINIFSQPENIIGITSQVFFATSIGVFFCGLLVRTENLLIPSAFHALVNFSFGAGELNQSVKEISGIKEAANLNLNSIVPTTIFFSFIFISGIFMILKTDKEVILKKLKME